jgi:hypothetical protein
LQKLLNIVLVKARNPVASWATACVGPLSYRTLIQLLFLVLQLRCLWSNRKHQWCPLTMMYMKEREVKCLRHLFQTCSRLFLR